MVDTKTTLRNLLFYQIFVRNYSERGNFQEVIYDLDRIQSLGVDVVYLLPVHPIGLKNRKGTLGSPYSISNYREINPELGTLNDFKRLIAAIHERKMKIMIDIVFNHTARDSVLLKEHPEWFYINKKGEFTNRVGEWWDVTDFDFSNDKLLWEELTDILKMYATMGVDGFRADVASLIPLDFWKFARKNVAKINKNIIWLSESVHGSFLKYIRDLGFDCYSESEIYQVFDMAYDYDVHPDFEAYLRKEIPLQKYLEAISRQEEIYPKNYVKLKNLENHDNKRIAAYLENDLDKIQNWTAFMFFQKGAAMIYNGQEFTSDKTPSLFEKDTITQNVDISDLIQKLAKIKKKKVFANGIYQVHIPTIDGVAYNTFEDESEKWEGIFNLAQKDGVLEIDLPDGKYRNQLTGKSVQVTKGAIELSKEPLVISVKKKV